MRTGLAGAKFYVKSEEEREKINNLSPGTELLLYREPDNEHDELAIAVYLTEDDQIGYVTRFKNETIARLMDAGKKLWPSPMPRKKSASVEEPTGQLRKMSICHFLFT